MRRDLRQVVRCARASSIAGENSLLNFQEYLESVVISLIAGNQPWWEYLHDKNWQILPQGLPRALRGICVNLGWEKGTRGGSYITEQITFFK